MQKSAHSPAFQRQISESYSYHVEEEEDEVEALIDLWLRYLRCLGYIMAASWSDVCISIRCQVFNFRGVLALSLGA